MNQPDVLKDKTMLVTGGTGTFGHKFVEMVLTHHQPTALRIYSRGEKLQHDMSMQFDDSRLRFLIGDVRDKNRLTRAMDNVDIVVHAAALKQVPACEFNPIEAVRTNIEGAVNIIDASLDCGVQKVMAISTDKAAYPVCLYGATKMAAEKLFVHANAYAGGKDTCFSCVRYGNVIGSRGSVIPLFLQQKEKGVLTITDTRMTRFWICIDDGVGFVIKAIGMMKGGEIFVPRIPSMKVTELAEAIAPSAEKRVTGIRPGERLHETLLTEEEARRSVRMQDGFIIEPESMVRKGIHMHQGERLPDGFCYRSDLNEEWLNRKDALHMINGDGIDA